jgi:hypothetical protein
MLEAMRLFRRLFGTGSWFRGNTPARLLALLTTGTLAQRVTVVLGVGVFLFAMFQALPWFALALCGAGLCWLAWRDFTRTDGK